MSKIKSLVASAMVVAGVTSTKAQQTLQKITQDTNHTIVELFQIRNGNTNNNVVGPAGYDQGLSEGAGTQIIYLESNGETYSTLGGQTLTAPTYPSEQIGNGTFEIATTPYQNNKSDQIYNRVSNDNNNPLPGGEFSLTRYNTDRDAIEDSNTNADLLHSKRLLPHTFDDGSPLPVGMHMILRSRDGYQDTGGTHASKRIGLRWDGNARVQQTADPAGNPYDILEGTLGVDDIQLNNRQPIIYPNPTYNDIRLNDGDQRTDESFDYLIYDITGRQVGHGSAREDQPISLHNTQSGIYIINTTDSDGDTSTYRVVKK